MGRDARAFNGLQGSHLDGYLGEQAPVQQAEVPAHLRGMLPGGEQEFAGAWTDRLGGNAQDDKDGAQGGGSQFRARILPLEERAAQKEQEKGPEKDGFSR